MFALESTVQQRVDGEYCLAETAVADKDREPAHLLMHHQLPWMRLVTCVNCRHYVVSFGTVSSFGAGHAC